MTSSLSWTIQGHIQFPLNRYKYSLLFAFYSLGPKLDVASYSFECLESSNIHILKLNIFTL